MFKVKIDFNWKRQGRMHRDESTHADSMFSINNEWIDSHCHKKKLIKKAKITYRVKFYIFVWIENERFQIQIVMI